MQQNEIRKCSLSPMRHRASRTFPPPTIASRRCDLIFSKRVIALTNWSIGRVDSYSSDRRESPLKDGLFFATEFRAEELSNGRKWSVHRASHANEISHRTASRHQRLCARAAYARGHFYFLSFCFVRISGDPCVQGSGHFSRGHRSDRARIYSRAVKRRLVQKVLGRSQNSRGLFSMRPTLFYTLNKYPIARSGFSSTLILAS